MAYAEEEIQGTEEQKFVIASQEDLALLNECIITGNETIDERNREADRLWREAVEKALDEGSEIITVANPTQENRGIAEIIRSTKVVSTNEVQFADGGPFINIWYYLAATYDVGAGNQVSGFRNLNPYVTYGLYGPAISIVGYTYTIIDGGRTFAVRTTLYVVVYPVGVARSATWQSYSEFYYTGAGVLYY